MNIDQIKKIHQEGRLDEAKIKYQAILKDHPDNVDALQFYAVLLAEMGELDDAERYMEKAITLAPANFSLRLNLANIFKSQGKLTEAEHILKQVLSLSPQYPAALNNLGTIYFAKEDWQQAIDVFQQAIDVQPDYADAYYNLGLAYAKDKQRQQAINVFEALMTLVPEHGGARFQRASMMMQNGNYQLAAEQFARIAMDYPHHFETLMNLAICYLKMGKLADAKQVFLQALALNADDAQLLFNLGVINSQLNLIDEAINNYQRCLKVAPGHADAHTNLAAIYIMKRDKQAAILHLQEVVRLRPHDDAIKHTLKIISGNQPLDAAPVSYIQTLFDSYADHYDAHVRHGLQYQVPEQLHDLVGQYVDEDKSMHVLDLGCGTGLCGDAFSGFAKSMTGVDLSGGMLDLASEKSCYDKLIKSDILEFLNKNNERFDLILAGDTVVYFSELNNLLASVFLALNEEGIFAFNVEKSATENIMPSSGRFAHHVDYVSYLAQENGFNVIDKKEIDIRKQENKSVSGVLFLLRRK